MIRANFSKTSISVNDFLIVNVFGLEKHKTIKTYTKDYLKVQEAMM